MSDQITAYTFNHITVLKRDTQLDSFLIRIGYGDDQEIFLGLPFEALSCATAYLARIVTAIVDDEGAETRN